MERLTARDEDNAYFPECFKEPCDGMSCQKPKCEFLNQVCSRLAEYEELGLMPEQLRQIDKLYKEKCEELAELQKPQEENEADDLTEEWKALRAAGILKSYCEKHLCCDCPLRGTGCNGTPISWNLPEEP